MKYRGKILNIGKEEVGKIQDEIEGKNKDNIQKKELKKDSEEKNKSQKSTSPIISIVTPYYNGQDYIDETAQSVLNQTFTNFEWIIVDDASSKEGKEKLKEIEKLDDRIKVINTGGIKNELVADEEDIDEQKNTISPNLNNVDLVRISENTREKRVDKEPVPNVRSCSGKRPWNKKLSEKC